MNLSAPAAAAARLESLLRQHDTAPLADDGFSARVLVALPPPRPKIILGWREWLVVALASGLLAVFGSGLAADLDASAGALGDTLAPLVDALEQPDVLLAIAIIVGALTLTAEDEPEALQPD